MKWTRLWLPALLVAAALLLASCGNTGPSGGGAHGGDDGMKGMDHGDSSGGETSWQETMGAGMARMDHSNLGHDSMDMGSGGMAREMVMEDGRYSERAFIDAMVPHHQGAVDMAEVALENADHEEIRSLAEDIVSAQEAEIEELKAIKQQEFGTSEVPMEMNAQEMKAMGMTDPSELANKDPFDKAFIDAMIPHHCSAIEMASVALRESHNAQIKETAGAIVDAQEKEIAQMERWREEWYPRG
jgi:uncharacterized protein (DUF305 family)/predicted small secreted protein